MKRLSKIVKRGRVLICAQIFNTVDLKYANTYAMIGTILSENGIAGFYEIQDFFSGIRFCGRKRAVENVGHVSCEGVYNFLIRTEVETVNVIVCHNKCILMAYYSSNVLIIEYRKQNL